MSIKDYSLSYYSTAFCLLTLTAWPYTERHMQCAQKSDSCLGSLYHRSIGILEAIPGGGLIALIERIIVFIYTHFSTSSGEKSHILQQPNKSKFSQENFPKFECNSSTFCQEKGQKANEYKNFKASSTLQTTHFSTLALPKRQSKNMTDFSDLERSDSADIFEENSPEQKNIKHGCNQEIEEQLLQKTSQLNKCNLNAIQIPKQPNKSESSQKNSPKIACKPLLFCQEKGQKTNENTNFETSPILQATDSSTLALLKPHIENITDFSSLEHLDPVDIFEENKPEQKNIKHVCKQEVEEKLLQKIPELKEWELNETQTPKQPNTSETSQKNSPKIECRPTIFCEEKGQKANENTNFEASSTLAETDFSPSIPSKPQSKSMTDFSDSRRLDSIGIFENNIPEQKNKNYVRKQEIEEQLLQEIPELKEWNLNEIQTVALSLLFHAMKDAEHPSFLTEKLHPKLELNQTQISYIDMLPEDKQIIAKQIIESKTNPIYIIKNLNKFIGKIKIETSSKEMIDIYNQYRIIQLRPPCSDILVLGCGNPPACRQHYRSNNESHDHPDADTINIHINMNPTLLSFWGNERNDAFFKEKEKKYRLIVDEGPICAFLNSEGHKDEFFRAARGALQNSGYLAIPTHIINPKGEIKRVNMPSDFKESNDVFIKKEAQAQSAYPITLFKYTPFQV